MNTAEKQDQAVRICSIDDLVANSGVCALLGDEQVAIFYLPEAQPAVYAISNWDPIGKAEVLSRGMVGDIGGVPVVASPLYKQHFDLISGTCLEDAEMSVKTYKVSLDEDDVWLQL